MRTLALILLMLGQVCAQDKPTRAACRVDLRVWTAAIRSADTNPACNDSTVACPFSGELKYSTAHQLMIVPRAAMACTRVDKHHRHVYEWAALRMEHFAVQRVGGFWLLNLPTFQEFLDWEQEQRGAVPTPVSDELDTVARNRTK